MNPFDLYAGTFDELVSTIQRNSVASGLLSINAFVEEFSVVASDSGDAPDLFPVEIYKEGNYGYQINAYNFDLETGEITFAVADTEFSDTLITFNRQHAEKYIKRAVRFFNNCKKASFVDDLEESSDAYELAAHIQKYRFHQKSSYFIFLTKCVHDTKTIRV